MHYDCVSFPYNYSTRCMTPGVAWFCSMLLFVLSLLSMPCCLVPAIAHYVTKCRLLPAPALLHAMLPWLSLILGVICLCAPAPVLDLIYQHPHRSSYYLYRLYYSSTDPCMYRYIYRLLYCNRELCEVHVRVPLSTASATVRLSVPSVQVGRSLPF